MNTSTSLKAGPSWSLLRLGEAWRNKAGICTLLASFVGAAVLTAAGTASGVFGIAALLGLLAFVILILGINAAGIQFMEQATGRPVSGVAAAFLASPMVALRTLGLGILLFLLMLVFTALAALVLFMCKIPVAGALLYALALPVLVFAAALAFLGLYVAGSLAAPALWEGHSLKSALSQLWAIATQRPMEAFLNLMLLFVAATLISLLVFGFLGAGASMIGGLSTAILGGDLMHGFGAVFSGGGSTSLATAGMFGAGIVLAVAVALYTAVFMLGLALTYLKVSDGIDLAAAQQAMDAALAKTRERAQQMAEEAKRRGEEARVAAQQRLEQMRAQSAAAAPAPAAAEPTTANVPLPDPAVAPPAPTAAALTCPSCHAEVQASDAFCGNCGHRLA